MARVPEPSVRFEGTRSRLIWWHFAGRDRDIVEEMSRTGIRAAQILIEHDGRLIDFHREHATAMVQVMTDLDAAAGQVPRDEHRAEAEPLVAVLSQARRARTGGVRMLSEILPEVLARLGVHRVESSLSGEADPT